MAFSTSAGSFTTTSGNVMVSAASLNHFAVTGTPTSAVVAGTPFSFTATAQDYYDNTVTGFSGTVTFSSTDTNAQSSLPIPSTLTNGVGLFSATLTLAGNQTITATDNLVTGTTQRHRHHPGRARSFRRHRDAIHERRRQLVLVRRHRARRVRQHGDDV